ncbi:MAG: histidine phosphatase family protein [Rickettsiales bacterium]|jgi:broad specificity phosphatase PhoE|nr:histidine phosphatase family protein [Rickettsiales bacterium]
MSVKITFEAHSTTYDNEAELASGWNDVELSPKGVEQSVELGRRSAARKFDAVFCSDLVRAVKTAEIAFAGTGIPIIPDIRLRECDYGEFTQRPAKEVSVEKPRRVDVPFPGGESYNDTTRRVGEFLSDLARGYDGRHVLIIGHRATQYALEHLILGVSLLDAVSAKFTWQPGWEYELG